MRVDFRTTPEGKICKRESSLYPQLIFSYFMQSLPSLGQRGYSEAGRSETKHRMALPTMYRKRKEIFLLEDVKLIVCVGPRMFTNMFLVASHCDSDWVVYVRIKSGIYPKAVTISRDSSESVGATVAFCTISCSTHNNRRKWVLIVQLDQD